MIAWVERYVNPRAHGRPEYTYVRTARDFETNTVDCWGLVMQVSEERFGVQLPEFLDYGDSSAESSASLERNQVHFEEIHGLHLARPGDILTFRLLSEYASHVGIVVDDRYFLHIHYRMSGPKLERYSDPRGGWTRKLDGIFRYPEADPTA